MYRGKNCIRKFCNHVIGEAHCLYQSFPEKPMEPLTKAQWKDYKNVSSCHICFKPFREGNQKVRDHCHYSGIYRGAAHLLCNLQYKIPSYILVVFHNHLGYDAQMFIKELASSSPDGAKMGVFAKNKEDYITFLISIEVYKYVDRNGEERPKEMELRFIDSFKFMSSSLDSLVNNLARGAPGAHMVEIISFLDSRSITSPNISYSFEREFTHRNIWMIGINLENRPSS